MLKNDMRKYIIEGKSYEDFKADMGEEYSQYFTEEIMERCWENTHKLVDEGEWLKYLKTKSAQYVKYLTMTTGALEEQGVLLRDTRAGGMLAGLMLKQKKAFEERMKLKETGEGA